jgi:hypothetical protein
VKSCKYCNGKYPIENSSSFGAGCSYQCKLDIKAKKDAKKGVSNNSFSSKPKSTLKVKPKAQLKPGDKGFKYSSFSSKPRKPLKSNTGLETKRALKSVGIKSKEAKEIKAVKKVKSELKLAITPHLAEKPKIDIAALERLAEISCHRYIRTRDAGKPCPCCGGALGDGYHAGHFKESGKNSMLRFTETNIHGQNAICNTGYNGDRGGFEAELRVREGDTEVDRLKAIAKSGVIKRWSADELIEIKLYYDGKYESLILSNSA